MYRLIISVLFVTFLSCQCYGQQIKYSDCTDTDPKDYCKINEVRILPCKEAGTAKTCNLKKGRTYQIQMDFTALQRIETIKSLPYWASRAADLPFVGMKENGCDFTQCPVAQDISQTYDFQLKIAKSLPRGQFDVKWKFFVDDSSSNGCCARFYLKLS